MEFNKYMREWLYGNRGYYENFKAIGKSGDFYTAVSTSRFFGASIANYLHKLIKDKNSHIIEIGAHKGYLICDIIEWIYQIDPSLIDTLNFAIVEKHPKIVETQKEYISTRLGEEFKITHFNSLDEIEVDNAFFIANEIFDAFSCDIFKDNEIAIVKNHSIVWEKAPQNILDYAKKYNLKKGEIPIGYKEFAKELSKTAKNIDFITFDYGEKYLRNDFSIRIYTKHKTLPLFDKEVNLKELFKTSDITYDVHFDHLTDSFKEANFKEVFYKTQAKTLIDFGIIEILELFASQTTQKIYQREADKIKTLISPTIMGDKFKGIHFKL